jgi:hypothetical protein
MTLFSIAFALALVAYLAGIGSIQLGAVIILGVVALVASLISHVVRMAWDERVLERRIKVALNALMESVIEALVGSLSVKSTKLNSDEFSALLKTILETKKPDEKTPDTTVQSDAGKAPATKQDAASPSPAAEKPARKPRSSKAKAEDKAAK